MVGALLAVALQTIVGWIVAVRLLALVHRTRELPEGLLGVSVLLPIAIGYPLYLAGPLTGSFALSWLGNACVSGGFAAYAVFVQRVFRPKARWSRILSLSLAAAFATQAVLCTPEGGPTATLWQMGLAIVAYGWGALEAGARARSLGRQLALGIGDRAVHNRFWLFSGIGAAVVVGAVANAAAILAGLPTQEPTVLFVTTISGITNATCTLLAFAPPRFYRERFARASA